MESECEFYDGLDTELRNKWLKEQQSIRDAVVMKDSEVWQKQRRVADAEDKDETDESESSDCSVSPSPLTYVAGFDISYVKGDDSKACAALVVCKLPQLEVVYEDLKMIEITIPYVAGFLSFREAPFVVDAFDRLRVNRDELSPQVLLIDGNGYLHKRGAGLACYVGVKLDFPTIGVSKNLFHVDDIQKDSKHMEQISTLKETGDAFPLFSKNGDILGMALKSCPEAHKPVYVSVGHRISIDTATWVVEVTSKHRVPEPIRQADIRSRQFLREKFPSAPN